MLKNVLEVCNRYLLPYPLLTVFLSGFITDYFESERGSFVFCGCVMILAAIVLCLIKVRIHFVNTCNATEMERTDGDKNEDFEFICTHM